MRIVAREHVSRAIAAASIAAFAVAATDVDVSAQIRVRVQASGFTTPLAFVQDPTDRATQFVVQQNGRIRVLRGASVLPPDFLDVSATIVAGGEQGLLGLAFPPNAATSRRFFVDFTNPSGDTVVARFRRTADDAVADPATRFDLRWGGAGGQSIIFQPFGHHIGGEVTVC